MLITNKNIEPYISVVIPTWNEAKYLSPCIDALQNQTYTNYEVIVVDRASDDDTVKMCKDAGWFITQQVSTNISGARADGFAKAKGEIIASTNADTIVPPDWLYTIARTFAKPEVSGTYGPVLFTEGKSESFCAFLNTMSFLFFSFTHGIGWDHPVGDNFAVRKSAYQAVGGFNTMLVTAEDVDLNYRIKAAGRITYHPQLIAYTSNRRVVKDKFRFFTHHFKNYIQLGLFGSASSDFTPIR